ncbi:SapC family protein [Biformimicrobium ophioploci]|uniref:SapC family protein n=1 Tax=Biformimicrobium ophioploci TaxID=3036711 RepID=A0ABQ6LWQ8_9GAMM|nr:SapC family protein [Microbulbifer sp. NKW57]GMG86531.1 SapC family protein [Microbulbifer sp. NKW57]
MTETIAPLNKEKHGKLRVVQKPYLGHIDKQHLLPVVVAEFSRVATEMPIVFVKHSETGEFRVVAVTGLKTGENLFISDDGWTGGYVPRCAGNYPFVLIPRQAEGEEEQFMVAINEGSEIFSENEGEALFSEDGEETEYLKARKEYLLAHLENERMTQAFTKFVVDKGLLEERNLSFEVKGEKIGINGIYVIDEKKLNELDDETFGDMRKRGLLGPIYTHLVSLNQLPMLGRKMATA